MFIAMILIIFYLSLQSVWGWVRHRNLVKALSAISKVVGGIAELPKEEVEKVEAAWNDAKNRSNENTAAACIVFLIISIYLIALGLRGHF